MIDERKLLGLFGITIVDNRQKGTSKYSFFRRTRARSRRCEAPRRKHSPRAMLTRGNEADAISQPGTVKKEFLEVPKRLNRI